MTNTQSPIVAAPPRRPDAILPSGTVFLLRVDGCVQGEYSTVRDAWGAYLKSLDISSMPIKHEAALQIDPGLGYLDLKLSLLEMLEVQSQMDELADFDESLRTTL